MKVLVNGIDITDYIVIDSYSMNSEEAFESWLDGNKVEHRIIVSEKVSGSFEVVLSNKNNMPTEEFLTLWNNAVNNHIVTILVYVMNKGQNKMINAFYKMECTKHEKLADGSFLDLMTIELQER